MRGRLASLVLAAAALPALGGAADEAGQIVRLAGVDAGLCVHVGCRDGSLAAELARGGRRIVHALAMDRGAVDRVRKQVARAGVYGQASVGFHDLRRLPYADDLVNLVVVDDLARALAAGLSLKEVGRVLCPDGVALLGQSPTWAAVGVPLTEARLRELLGTERAEDIEIVAQHGLWARVRKRRPAAMDDWTHRAYDASGNCVSHDTAIGPLHGLRWLAGPAWPMGTYYQVSNGGTVAAGGRVFYVTLNEVSSFRRLPQERNNAWFLVARDASNGLRLWSRAVGLNMARDGQEFGNCVVATPKRVFALLGTELVALDAATGKTERVLARGVPPGGRLLHHDGRLVLAAGKTLRALGVDGTAKWQRPIAARDAVVADGQVLYTTGDLKTLASLDLATGKPRWTADISAHQGKQKQLLLAGSGVAVVVWERNWSKGENGIAAFSTRDGRRLWARDYASSRATWPNTVWLVDRLVWHREGKAGLVGLVPTTGEPKRRITLKGGYCGGCVRDIATERFLVSTRPPNFFEWKDGSVHGFRGGRHGCRAGVIVANGLLYTEPHGCKCVRESVRGFAAFGPAPRAAPTTARALERTLNALRAPYTAPPRPDDWPTFRHDPCRTGATKAVLSPRLKRSWAVTVDDHRAPAAPLADEWAANPLGGDRLTAPVVAGDTVFVGLPDAHRVVALDAATGKEKWRATVGGRVDVPPTIYEDLCLAGCRDGWVYCLRADTGAMAWRLRAAPDERLIVAFGQLESAWPVVGGVLVDKGVGYCVTGRSSAADGGLTGIAFSPASGETIWRKPLRAAGSDLLVAEGDAIRMAGAASAGFRFDTKTGDPLRGNASAGFKWAYSGKIHGLWGGPNRVLDRSWRFLGIGDRASHWMRIKQGYGPYEGKLLVAAPDGKAVYGYRHRYVHWSKEKDPATEVGGELVAWTGGREAWTLDVPGPFQIEALILAGDVLVAAGPVDRFRRKPGGRLWAVSAREGKLLRELPLGQAPAADGLAVTRGRLFLTTHDGRMLCFAAE